MRFRNLAENADMVVEHGIAVWTTPGHCWYHPMLADDEGEVYISQFPIPQDEFDMRKWVSSPQSYVTKDGKKLKYYHIQLAPINWELKPGDWELVILQASPDYGLPLPFRTRSAKQLSKLLTSAASPTLTGEGPSPCPAGTPEAAS